MNKAIDEPLYRWATSACSKAEWLMLLAGLGMGDGEE
jgi:hypothetical protein